MEAFFRPKLAVVLGFFLFCFVFLSVCFALCSSRLCFCGSALLHISPFSPIFLRQIQILSGYFKRGKSRREGHDGGSSLALLCFRGMSPLASHRAEMLSNSFQHQGFLGEVSPQDGACLGVLVRVIPVKAVLNTKGEFRFWRLISY